MCRRARWDAETTLRRGACLVLAIAAVTAGGATGAAPRLVVTPVSPAVGAKATIELRASLKPPVYATLRAPNGIRVRLRLRRAAAGRWRVSYAFLAGGRWTVQAGGATKQVLIRAPLSSPPPAPTFVPLGAPGCSPPSPSNLITGEVRGRATIGDLWAVGFWLNLADRGVTIPANVVRVVGKPFKITWRLQGSGDASFTAIAPDGRQHAPVDLQFHPGGSNWNRPGDEWGSIFVFTEPGCWHMHVERDDNRGDIWLLVRS
jgi:hypothetical protein